MGKLREERGYTLVILLLLIVLFLGFSTVFINISLSHAKQEKVVDNSNLAVVAAEMGVEYYKSSFENFLPVAFNYVLQKEIIKQLLADIENCHSAKNIEICRMEKKEILESKALELYIQELDKNLTGQIDKGPLEIDSENLDLIFFLESKSVRSESSFNKIIVNLAVVGENVTSNKKLFAEVKIPIPGFLSVSENGSPGNIESVFDIPEDLPVCNYNSLSTVAYPCKLGENQKVTDVVNSIPNNLLAEVKITVNDAKVLCQEGYKKNGVCIPHNLKGVTIYSKSDDPMTVYFNNDFNGFNWYHKGTIEVDEPMNNSDSTFVFEKLIINKPFNNIKGTIVLMESAAIKEILTSYKQIKPDTTGKMCLNLSSLSLDELNQVKSTFDFNNGSKGKVYYYIENTFADNIKDFNLLDDSRVIKHNDAKNFLSACNLHPVQSSNGTEFGDFIFPDLEIEVEY